jgi:hypothetical protein
MPEKGKAMDFGGALAVLKMGGKVARAGWDHQSGGYIVLDTKTERFLRGDHHYWWIADMEDLLAEDWFEPG